jgi:hypothetical protein
MALPIIEHPEQDNAKLKQKNVSLCAVTGHPDIQIGITHLQSGSGLSTNANQSITPQKSKLTEQPSINLLPHGNPRGNAPETTK